ncbi:NTP transferase domain-containing protein [Paenibacillus sp. HJL G12]|uniref:NTP transferase domain-containing protein n=1 Tax=Paenibacillus dendrobii TaxID=2691084 RepID=A0A7X3LFH0_9BACL|nr:nucleotidyltransferase family protein [Paenibacillus dendrobii]MWV43641.1 NTP transferase domain-containing protein [Paenibacillus dendrobii]
MKALILAAGYATRLYPLTRNMPKSLLPLGDITILDLIIRKMEEVASITDIIIVSNAKFHEHFINWADSRSFQKKVNIIHDGSTSEDNRLGAIGDIQFAIEKEGIDEDLLVCAGDNVFTFDLGSYVDYFLRQQTDCILVQRLQDSDELRRVGVVELDDSSRVLSFEEKPEHPKTDIGVFAVYLYRKETLPLFKDYLLSGHQKDAPGYFPEWLSGMKELSAYFAEGVSYDMGTHEAYRKLQELMKNL